MIYINIRVFSSLCSYIVLKDAIHVPTVSPLEFKNVILQIGEK